jgi:hypothetical protein
VNDSRWSETELAYFAGLLDGEGCFGFGNFGKHTFVCRLSMGNTNLRLLSWVKDRFGGTIFPERRSGPGSHRWKPVFRWVAAAADLEQIIPAILPYLVGKREQAELVLLYRQTLQPPIKGHRSAPIIPEAVKAERHRIVNAMAVLNKRGA